MEDLEKAYTTDEIRNLSYKEWKAISKQISEAINTTVTTDDQKTIRKYTMFLDRPYDFGMNPHSFKIAEERQAEERHEEIQNIAAKVYELRNRILSSLPPNMRSTMEAGKIFM